MSAMTRVERVALEEMLDRYPANQVLSVLSEICDKKAERCKFNWQDSHLVKAWSSLGLGISRLAARAQQEML